jgi:hypothetical protein
VEILFAFPFVMLEIFLRKRDREPGASWPRFRWWLILGVAIIGGGVIADALIKAG